MNELRPLPMDFYDKNAWYDSIIDFYGVNPKFPEKNILGAPIKLLTDSVSTAIDIVGDVPYIQKNFFNQVINPLYQINEYENKIYKGIKDKALSVPEPKFNKFADAMLNIRKLFAKDKVFLTTNFQKEIAGINKPEDAEKYSFFSDSIHKITKIHINQIVEIIDEEMKA